jgi:hypothetical protein
VSPKVGFQPQFTSQVASCGFAKYCGAFPFQGLRGTREWRRSGILPAIKLGPRVIAWREVDIANLLRAVSNHGGIARH